MSFSSVKVFGEKATPNKVYYNATVINNITRTDQSTDDPNVTYADNRQTAVVLDVSKYDLSVENFSINGASKNLPVFIPQIDPSVDTNPAGDVNQTIYTISMCVFDGANYNINTQPVIWESENQASFTVVPTQLSPQLESDYYYCYSYTHWITLVNRALRLAWSNCGGDTAQTTFGTQCPFFTFDAKTGLFTLCQDANTCMVPYGDTLPNPFAVASSEVGYQTGEYSFIGMNSNLEGLLTNFNTTYWSANSSLWQSSGFYLPENTVDFGLVNLSVGAVAGNDTIGILQNNTQFLVNPFTNNNLATSFLCVPQDFISTGTLWSPIRSFVITTTKIPVRNEFISNPVPLGQQNIGTQNASASAFQKVLIETPINAVTADIWRGWILYEPLTPTLSSLEDSKVALYEIDFYVYWRNRLTGSLVPLKLYNEGSFSIRLLFDKIT